MDKPREPSEREPVSVHAPFISYPDVQYRREWTEERRTTLLAALTGVQLGAYDERIVQWLAGRDLPVVAAVVSSLGRPHHAAAQHAQRGAGVSL